MVVWGWGQNQSGMGVWGWGQNGSGMGVWGWGQNDLNQIKASDNEFQNEKVSFKRFSVLSMNKAVTEDRHRMDNITVGARNLP